MGCSGSGKSTMLHLLGGLDRSAEREVLIDGINISQLDDEDATLTRRAKTGFVFQFFNLIPLLNVAENVALPFLIAGDSLADHRERVDELLELVGLSDKAKQRPDQLSAGEQQRVALARALATEPAILLADEPTGNLDFTTGTEILDLLWDSCDRLGQTIVLVTHDARAAAYADRVLVVRDGDDPGRDRARTPSRPRGAAADHAPGRAGPLGRCAWRPSPGGAWPPTAAHGADHHRRRAGGGGRRRHAAGQPGRHRGGRASGAGDAGHGRAAGPRLRA